MTPKQSSILAFIRAYIAANTHSPSYDEIKSGCGLSSKGQIPVALQALRRDGYLTFVPFKARSIKLVGVSISFKSADAVVKVGNQAFEDFDAGKVNAVEALNRLRGVINQLEVMQ